MMTSTLTSSRAETVKCVQGGLEQVKSNQILIPDITPSMSLIRRSSKDHSRPPITIAGMGVVLSINKPASTMSLACIFLLFPLVVSTLQPFLVASAHIV